jgi:hypothetical protein
VKTGNKVSAVDEKKLQAGLKKLAVSAVPGIESVQIFKEDGSVVQFSSPKGAFFIGCARGGRGGVGEGGGGGGGGGEGAACRLFSCGTALPPHMHPPRAHTP